MIQWWHSELGKEEAEAASRVILSNYVNEGPLTREFEKQVGAFLNIPYVKAVPNGTVALSCALWAVGIKPGDEVLVPAVTFIATAHAVQMVGAVPVLVDVDQQNLNLSIADAQRKITAKTRGIIAVHINGRSADLQGLKALRERHSLFVIEDAAEALGSRNHEQYLGTVFDVGCVSLAPSKVISTAQGGLLLTHRRELHDRFVQLKDHGRLSRAEIHHPMPGYNFKFTDIQAAIGIEQMKRLPARLEKAKSDHLFYYENLKGIRDLEIMLFDLKAGEVPLWIDARSPRRAELLAHLKRKEIFAQPIWEPLHRSWIPSDGTFPNASRIGEEVFWLPSGPTCPMTTLETVAREVAGFFL
jgi:dTDP-4-amino-4,6-dideoxygalactose transaminase